MTRRRGEALVAATRSAFLYVSTRMRTEAALDGMTAEDGLERVLPKNMSPHRIGGDVRPPRSERTFVFQMH